MSVCVSACECEVKGESVEEKRRKNKKLWKRKSQSEGKGEQQIERGGRVRESVCGFVCGCVHVSDSIDSEEVAA